MSAWRFRAEGELLVLQVAEAADRDYYGDRRTVKWRDATVSDIPTVDPFDRPERPQMVVTATDSNGYQFQTR
jgi:hypothetical protein